MDVSFFLPVFEALEKGKIKYVAVGGIAVVLHGFPRVTGDIDLVLELSADNAAAAMQVLTRLGFKPKVPVNAIDFANAGLRQQWIKERGMRVFSLYQEKPHLIEVDLFVQEPIPFPDMYARSKIHVIDGISIRIASIDDLITLKQQAGRSKDLEDIEALELIKKYVKE